MKRKLVALGVWFCIGTMPAFAQQLKVGDHVQSSVSGYNGYVVEVGGVDGYVKIALDGHPPEHASWMNPRYWKPAGGGQGGMPINQGQNPGQNPGGQPAGAGAQVGTHVQFDRAQGSQPQYQRWDSGTVVGRDPFGRIQIKSDTNGTIYPIEDNAKWIITNGSQPPGRRHDYTDQPVAPPAANNGNGNRPNGGGATGPFNGEWTVVSLDGRRIEPGAQNFNFVGSCYEILNQGMTMSGNFSVNGNTVRMISDDGTPFATFQYSMQGNQMVLNGAGTNYVLVPAHK